MLTFDYRAKKVGQNLFHISSQTHIQLVFLVIGFYFRPWLESVLVSKTHRFDTLKEFRNPICIDFIRDLAGSTRPRTEGLVN